MVARPKDPRVRCAVYIDAPVQKQGMTADGAEDRERAAAGTMRGRAEGEDEMSKCRWVYPSAAPVLAALALASATPAYAAEAACARLVPAGMGGPKPADDTQ